jgi:hypothetical protein
MPSGGESGKRIGSRGCPGCGSHNTEGTRGKNVVYWCRTCRHRWLPCSSRCRGYVAKLDAKDGPLVLGCVGCGVPDRVARMWPEAYRALARELDFVKQSQLTDADAG